MFSIFLSRRLCIVKSEIGNGMQHKDMSIARIYNYTPRNEVRGGILDSACLSVCLSVCPSVCLSVCPLTFRVRPVASTVQDGFFPYLVQMITSMRRCVACDDLWPWPISSRSFDLDLENRVRSVASTVRDGFLLYLAKMITIIRGCVAFYVFFKIWKFEFLANFLNFSVLTLKKKSTVLDGFFPYSSQIITSMRGCVACNDLWPWPVFSRSFGLDLENRVRSVVSIVLDGFFPYLITSMRRCVACDDLTPWPISSRSFDLVLTWDPTWLNSVGNHERAGGILRTRCNESG